MEAEELQGLTPEDCHALGWHEIGCRTSRTTCTNYLLNHLAPEFFAKVSILDTLVQLTHLPQIIFNIGLEGINRTIGVP